jgi:hypothetical protein
MARNARDRLVGAGRIEPMHPLHESMPIATTASVFTFAPKLGELEAEGGWEAYRMTALFREKCGLTSVWCRFSAPMQRPGGLRYQHV